MAEDKKFTSTDIRGRLPHRYPFLLIDRADEVKRAPSSPLGDSIVAYKAVTQNEPFFQGHFPDNPVMPGVLIVEAMTQTASLVAGATTPYIDGEDTFYLTGVNRARFRHPVLPGHVLKFTATTKKVRQNKYWIFDVQAHILGEDSDFSKELLVAEAQVSAVLTKGGRT